MIRLLIITAAYALHDNKKKASESEPTSLAAELTPEMDKLEKQVDQAETAFAEKQLEALNDEEKAHKDKYTKIAMVGGACFLLLVGLLVAFR